MNIRHITDVELVGNWPSRLVQVSMGPLALAIDTANFDYHVKQLPTKDIGWGLPQELRSANTVRTIASNDTQLAAIDNGPIVTKDGVRRGNNSLAMRSIGRVSRHNAQRPNMVSHSKILVDKASQKKEKALAIPEQVGRMIQKCHELEANICKKYAKGHSAINLIKCLERTQAQVRFMLDHCEEKGLLEIQPMKTGKAIGSLGKKAA